MNRETTAVFIGHDDCFSLSEHKLRLEIENIINNGIITFLNGGMGCFDRMCAKIVFDFKEKYPQIKNYLIIPYINFNVFEKKYFDEIIYPETLEFVHYKAKIQKRNRFMVEKASVAVCYVKYPWGGAAQTYRIAEKENLKIINLAN